MVEKNILKIPDKALDNKRSLIIALKFVLGFTKFTSRKKDKGPSINDATSSLFSIF